MGFSTTRDSIRLLLASFIFCAFSLNACAVGSATQPTRVAVLNFFSGKKDAIAREIRQALLTSIATDASVSVSAIDVEAIDAGDAIKKAKGFDYVVFGSVQKAGHDVRISGLIVDGSTAKVMGGLKAEGSVRDRFDVEDALCEQARRSLPGKPVTVAAVSRRPGEGWVGPPLTNHNAVHTPWDHPYVDTDAVDSLNNLNYGDLDLLSNYAGFGFGSLGFGGLGGGSFGSTYNTGYGGLPR